MSRSTCVTRLGKLFNLYLRMYIMSPIWAGVRDVMNIAFSACSRLDKLAIASCLKNLRTSYMCTTPVNAAFKFLSDAMVV